MSDDGGGLHVRQTPRTRAREAQIADFTMLVRIPGQPAAGRVYTQAEHDEAAQYAAAAGGAVVPLPLVPAAGYTAGPSGSQMPLAVSEGERFAAEASSARVLT